MAVCISCRLKIFTMGNVENRYFRKLFEVYFSSQTPKGEITCRVWNRESFLESVLLFLFLWDTRRPEPAQWMHTRAFCPGVFSTALVREKILENLPKGIYNHFQSLILIVLSSMKKCRIGLSCSSSNVRFSSTAWLIVSARCRVNPVWDRRFQGVHRFVRDLRSSLAIEING